ncbi:probable cytochrome P450 49a1 [Uloborus diversus]|uniref:probable cytochrome P450 49a1 n=1 Tax=Uloborus diversus TaxID=327109 RepID=UPI002409B1BB|nr:probable cytochrome P450 49a1 [Uloborus diversus]
MSKMKQQIAKSLFQRGLNFSNFATQLVRNSATATVNASSYYDAELAAAKPFEEMPKLPMVPILGSSWTYMPIIGKYNLLKLHEADREKHKIYGDVVRERFGHLNAVLSFNPADMETIFRQEGSYPSRESRKQWYKTTGIMVLSGPEWWDLRSKVQKHLMKPKAIQSYLSPMQDVAQDLVDRIYKERDQQQEFPDLLLNLYNWALESVALVGLDTRLGCLSSNLTAGSDSLRMINAVQTQFECMNKLEAFAGNFQYWKYFSTPTWKRFTKAADTFTEIAFKYINKAVESLKNKKDDEDLTLLQNMLLTKGLDASGAMVTVADMLMAGIDTTSHTVGFMLYHLSKHPDKQEILFDELKRLLPNKGDRISPEVFSELRYLKSCLKESIRLDPIVRGNARTLDHDVVVSGYRVPAGTTIFVILQQICRSEKYFKNANQYIPERWLDKDEKPSNPFSYVPFGIGTRSCVGRRLAELEIICLIAQILRNFKLEYHHEDIDMHTRLVNIPDRPLRFNFIERS